MSADQSNNEAKKQQIDIYKIRIEDYDRNYFSLRELEWKMALQFLFGYIAIGVGFHQLRTNEGTTRFLAIGCGVLIALLLLTFIYFRLRLHARLTWVRDQKNEFIRKLHSIDPATLNSKETPYTLPGAGIYAMLTQFSMHFLTAISAVLFIVGSRLGWLQP